MDNIEILLKEVNEKINEQECVKEYFRLKKIIQEDEHLKKLDDEVRLHQKKMCEFQNDDEIYFKEKALYESNLKELESNPVYINFNEVKKEVNELLLEVRDYLS